MFCVTENDILNVYKEEGKLKEYEYCKDYLKLMKREKIKPLTEDSNKFNVKYNSLLRWKNKIRTPYGIKCINFLKERNLLPYYPNKVTSRIVGFLHGDGYLFNSLLYFGFVSKNKKILLKLKKMLRKSLRLRRD